MSTLYFSSQAKCCVYFILFQSGYMLCLLYKFPVVLYFVSTSYVSGCATCWGSYIPFRSCYKLGLFHTFPVAVHIGSTSHVFDLLHIGSLLYVFDRDTRWDYFMFSVVTYWFYFIRFRSCYVLCLLYTFSVVFHVGFTSYVPNHTTYHFYFILSLLRYTFYLLHAVSFMLHVPAVPCSLTCLF